MNRLKTNVFYWDRDEIQLVIPADMMDVLKDVQTEDDDRKALIKEIVDKIKRKLEELHK